MKIYVKILLAFTLILFIAKFDYCWSFDSQGRIINIKQEFGPGGVWKSKTQWKAHWVKHWETRKIWVPVWRKVWGPVEVKEWIPLPKPPPLPERS